MTQLTDNDVDDEWPDWSPDGQLIAFSRGDLLELEGSLYLMRPNGSRQRRVPPASRQPCQAGSPPVSSPTA